MQVSKENGGLSHLLLGLATSTEGGSGPSAPQWKQGFAESRKEEPLIW